MLAIPSEVEDLVESGRFAVRYLIKFDLGSGLQGIWNDTYPLTSGGVTYAPLGGNMTFDAIPGSTQLDADRLRVVVSNLAPAVTGIIQNEIWHQRACVLSVAFLDDAGEVLHVMDRFAGFLDDVEISDADQDFCTLTLNIESNNRELNRSNGRTRGDGDQRNVSATDGFFKHTAAAASDANIYWGRKGPQRPR